MNKTGILYGPNGDEITAAVRPQDRDLVRALKTIFRSTFNAASQDRHVANWGTTSNDLNVALQSELRLLRARSRSMCRNNPYAASAINQFLNFIIGTGFTLQMRVVRPVIEQDVLVMEEDEQHNDTVEALFGEWSADVDYTTAEECPDSFIDFQEQALVRLIEDGEIFVQKYVDRSHPTVPFRLQIIDADWIDTYEYSYNRNPIVMGVEIDRDSLRPVAYWRYRMRAEDARYPLKSETVRVPASEMVHIFPRMVPFQVRGVPFMSAVMRTLFNAVDYNDTQMIRNKIAAAFSVLLKGGQKPGNPLRDTTSSETSNGDGFPVDANGNVISTIAPGIFGTLPEGVEPFLVNPTSPESTFDQFMIHQLRPSAAGIRYGMSYYGMTRDTSAATFASGRVAENMDFQGYRRLQRFFGRKLLRNILHGWMDAAVLSGQVTAPTYGVDPAFWRRHEWMPSSWARGINPSQEVEASGRSMELNLTTFEDECAMLGRDWRTQLIKAARIRKFREKLGLNATEPPKQIQEPRVPAKEQAAVPVGDQTPHK